MKRRLIKPWTEYCTARQDYDCTKCDTPIVASTEYTRYVFALPNRLEIEREHMHPDCPNRYY